MRQLIIFIAILGGFSPVQAQWYPVNSNATKNTSLYGIFFVDSMTGYCVGGVGGDRWGPQQSSTGVILKTIDGGENWNMAFSHDSLAIKYVVGFDNEVYAFALGKGSSLLVYSSDYGINWIIENISYEPLGARRYAEINHGVKLYNKEIYFLDRKDWNLKKLSNGHIQQLTKKAAFLFAINQHGIIYINSRKNALFRSDDFGKSWYALTLPLDKWGRVTQNMNYLEDIGLFNDTIILYTTYPGAVHYSIDNGISWSRNFGQPQMTAPGITPLIVNSTTLYGMRYWTDSGGKVLGSKNLGLSWGVQDGNIEVRIHKLYFYDNQLGFAIGGKGTIYKTTNGGGLGIEEEETNLKKKIEVFPNPTEGTLQLVIVGDIGVKNIALYNLAGKLLKHYDKSERNLDVSDISSGQYLIHLETTEGIFTEKIVVE